MDKIIYWDFRIMGNIPCFDCWALNPLSFFVKKSGVVFLFVAPKQNKRKKQPPLFKTKNQKLGAGVWGWVLDKQTRELRLICNKNYRSAYYHSKSYL